MARFVDIVSNLLDADLREEWTVYDGDLIRCGYLVPNAWSLSCRLDGLCREARRDVQHWRLSVRVATPLDVPMTVRDVWTSEHSDKVLATAGEDAAAALRVVARDCAELRELRRAGDPWRGSIDDAALLPIASSCGKLEVLDVEGCALRGHALWAFAAGCPRLRELSIGELGVNCLAPLAGRLLRLRLVDVTLSGADLRWLSSACPRLEQLQLRDKGPSGWGNKPNTLMDARAATFGALRGLALTAARAGRLAFEEPRSVLHRVPRCPQATSLAIVGVPGEESAAPRPDVDDEQVAQLAARCPLLATMRLERFDCFRGSIEKLVGFSRLSDLSLAFINHRHRPEDRPLPFRYDLDDGLIAVCRAQRLERLVLSFVNIGYRGICAVAASCPRLHTLELTKLERVTKAAMDALRAGVCTLTHFTVRACYVDYLEYLSVPADEGEFTEHKGITVEDYPPESEDEVPPQEVRWRRPITPMPEELLSRHPILAHYDTTRGWASQA